MWPLDCFWFPTKRSTYPAFVLLPFAGDPLSLRRLLFLHDGLEQPHGDAHARAQNDQQWHQVYGDEQEEEEALPETA